MKPITVALSALAFVCFAAARKGNDASVSTSVPESGTGIDSVQGFTTSFTESSVGSTCTKAIRLFPSSSDDKYPYNPFFTTTTIIQHWCNGYPCGENGELRSTVAAERRGPPIEPDRSYSPIHEPGEPCTTSEVIASALPASSTLSADNGDPSTTSEVFFSVQPVQPTSVTGIPSEFWYLLVPTSSTSLTYGAVPSSDLGDKNSSPVARASPMYTIDCTHHYCPSGMPTVITMMPFLPEITVKPSGPEHTHNQFHAPGNPQTYPQTAGEKRETGVPTGPWRRLDLPPITMQTTVKSVVTRNPKISFPDVPPKPTQTQPYPLSVSIPSLSPLPQSVASIDPCYRHYCAPGQSAPAPLTGNNFSAN
ncbi:hypothetical protein B5807_06576 [Epicoccum nigrum]|uniref:Extracellular serine-rich protein n=1 Tax=Epicoccum nigrum TaxID=105696 RepID=A0A1Y2LWQ6_EPING|nr:hypothetical protein B5807_06576 [Epicoccum nigrum]